MMKLFAFMALLAVTCTQGVPSYNVAVKNVSSGELQDAYISYGEFTSLNRPLRPGDHTRQVQVEYPIPNRMTVTWRTADGAEHSKEMDVSSVSKNFSGDIFFDIGDGEQVRMRLDPNVSSP